MNDDKEIRSDAKLKNLPREMRDDLWRMRHPEEDGEKVRYIDILAWLKGKGVDSSLGALSEYYSWERMERRMEAARASAAQAGRMLAADPNATPEDVARVGQMVFTSEMVNEGNLKAFVQLEKLRFERDKLVAAAKGKIDAGLDALFDEIKGNPKAEKLFAELKATVAKA